MSAALPRSGGPALRATLEACSRECLHQEVEEALLQSYLFLGYPVALNALRTWREVSGEGPLEPTPDAWERWAERGEGVCQRVYGGQYERLRSNIREIHPDMERWMVVEGYGKVLGRPGLDLVTRELCVGALLAVLGTTRQLYSHVRGALNAGATREEVGEALDIACEGLSSERSGRVRELWRQVEARHRRCEGSNRQPWSGGEPCS
jgi:4-carboxymuconolactone decarboxylase